MIVLNDYHSAILLVGVMVISSKISGTSQSPSGIIVEAVQGSDFVIISWKYQESAKFYRIFFKGFNSMQGNSNSPPHEVGPMQVYCLADNTTCSYCVSNSDRDVSCNKFNKNYGAPLLESKLEYEEPVSIKVEACTHVYPDSCQSHNEWINYTIPAGAPSAVRDVHARPLSSKTVEVTWFPPYQTRGTIVMYTILYKTDHGMKMGEEFRRVSRAIITGLSAKTTYSVWMTASTARKEGAKSNIITVQTYEDECVSNPCQHHGKCHVDGMSYLCNCLRAWEGANCEIPESFVMQKNLCIDTGGGNKLPFQTNVSLEFCSGKCRENLSCKSFEYGLGYGNNGTFVKSLRRHGLGICKMQGVDATERVLIACNYDYYEKRTPVSAGSISSLPYKALITTLALMFLLQK
ncbi:hypothetical protein pdam_00019788 [Pocillopora damicornis]|uniref:Fibronectin type-III domain-containing protein n=1 Tax=Pocillopora damicornis TaxID=46731 RepID=A0A3M6UGQ2_POCDA|nr:uncharacterized protein LOC113664707 [Pocillopora damicornis]RMX52558.1 hypothetical protein pdam_00019788 [Pocillopora damicornis]